jgi:phosphinothricin acetyltransferase
MDFTIEKMEPADWPQVSTIYSAGIKTGIATFQRDVPSWKEWDQSHLNSCRFVARFNDVILGWAALSPTSSRCVYAGVAEVSIYIDPEYKHQGIGTKLLKNLIQQSEKEGFWSLQAGIIKENTHSRELHQKCEFRELGFRERLGQMSNEKWHDVVLMERGSKAVG